MYIDKFYLYTFFKNSVIMIMNYFKGILYDNNTARVCAI